MMKRALKMYNDALYVRLHTCLQTILELEPTFSENTFENCAELKELFTMLKDSLAQLGEVQYEPEDVERIERSVAVFLQAIKPQTQKSDKKLYSGRILQ